MRIEGYVPAIAPGLMQIKQQKLSVDNLEDGFKTRHQAEALCHVHQIKAGQRLRRQSAVPAYAKPRNVLDRWRTETRCSR